MLTQLRKHWRGLLTFALAFQLLENFLFTPAMGLIGRALDGRPVVDSTQLVSFFLSFRGLLIVLLSAMVGLTIRLAEHAGLSAMVLGALEGKEFRPFETFRWLAGLMLRLGRVGGWVIGCSVALIAPLLLIAGLLVRPLLSKHDINYYLATHPPEFVTSALVLGVLAAAITMAGLWLLVRWRLVVQVCLFDQRDGSEAFREAAKLSRGVRFALAGRCLGILAFLGVLLLAAAGLQQLVVWLVLRVAGHDAVSFTLSFAVALLLRTLVGAGVTSLGALAEAAVFTSFYLKRRRALGGEPSLPNIREEASSPLRPRARRMLVASAAVGLLVATGLSVALTAEALRHDRPTLITAHRGGHHLAPENTVAAIREAMTAGAQYAEIDVQLSKDGVLVVTHDSDFSRMGGVAKKVWDLTYEEIKCIPLGAKSAPEFRGACAPTFDEALSAAENKIGLNIELKYYGDHQPRLAERVVEALRSRHMTQRVVIQCLEYEALMEVRRLAPEIPVGYLMSMNAKRPERLKVDFLSVQLSRATGAFVQSAHRRGQGVHVWTVDKGADMDRMIALGADALITNEPAEALRRVREYAALSRPERIMRQLHAWLAD